MQEEMGASEKNNTADTGMVIKIELLTSLFKSPFCATQEREELVGCIDSFAKSQHPISCPPPAPPIPLPTLTKYYNNDSTLRNLHSSHRITNKMTLAALWKKKKKNWRTAGLQPCACTDIYWIGIMFRKDGFAFNSLQVYVQHSTNIPKTTVTFTTAKPRSHQSSTVR